MNFIQNYTEVCMNYFNIFNVLNMLQVINYSESRTVEEIIENSTKIITLIDLCGHQKYLKTTIFGLTGYSPDFAMLVVSANTGLGKSKLDLKIFVVIFIIFLYYNIQ